MYYTVYRITNIVNEKIYIGVHKTTDLNDSYMGSGKYLKNSIKKHGIKNFKKEYLAIFDNPDDMFNMESELVNEEFVKSSSSYNVKEGGDGGWDHVNLTKSNVYGLNGKIGFGGENLLHGNDLKTFLIQEGRWDLHRSKISFTLKQNFSSGKIKPGFKDKRHSLKTKQKIGIANSINQRGSGNSQFGSMWITDQVSNKKISKDNPIPQGWMKGRV